MRRRTLLQAAVPVACTSLVGCSGTGGGLGIGGRNAAAEAPRARLDMTAVNDLEIAWRVHGTVENPDGDRAKVIAQAAKGETAAVEAFDPPFEDGELVVHGGTLYRLSVTVTDEEPMRVFPVVLNDLAYDGVTAAPGDERIRFEELPAVDRQVFRERGLADGETMGIGTSFAYNESEVERSALVPEPEYGVVVWGPSREGRFSLRGEPRTRTLSTYLYAVETVAESAAAYGGRLREEHALDLTDVPAAEAEILSTATGEDTVYTVPSGATPGEAFRSLAERFRPATDVLTVGEDGDRETETLSGTYLVRFDGDVYWTRLFVRESVATTAGTA